MSEISKEVLIRFAQIMCINMEVEGMKAENQACKHGGHSITYNKVHFDNKAEFIRMLIEEMRCTK